MKKDLDYIFKKIRAIKTKLSAQYPTEFAEAVRNSLAEECEEDTVIEEIKDKKDDDSDKQNTDSISNDSHT